MVIVSVPIPGTISPNRITMSETKRLGLFPSPFRGLYLQIVQRFQCKVFPCFRPHSGDYISKWLRSLHRLKVLPRFRPHSGDYISKWIAIGLLRGGKTVSVPIPGTISPNLFAMIYKTRCLQVSVPIPGTISPNCNFYFFHDCLHRFPSPFRGLYLQIIFTMLTLHRIRRFRPHSGDYISKLFTYGMLWTAEAMFPSPFRGLYLQILFFFRAGFNRFRFRPHSGVSVPLMARKSGNWFQPVSFPSPFRGLYLQIKRRC